MDRAQHKTNKEDENKTEIEKDPASKTTNSESSKSKPPIKFNFRILSIFLCLALVLSLGVNILLAQMIGDKSDNMSGALIKTVSAKELYEAFICPCCDRPIDSDCCPMAKERKEYVDSLIETGKSEEEIMLAYVQKYGLDSFADKNKAKEFREKLVAAAPADRPVISINPSSRDLGDVSQKGGTATTSFELKNEGNKDLVINKLETSCGCTSASIIYQGKEGPTFTMPGHGEENPTDWQVTIKPQETAQLKVYYDPTAHEDLTGAVIREIYVYSNDSVDFEKEVSIGLNQVQ